jgi:hypothetical protein
LPFRDIHQRALQLLPRAPFAFLCCSLPSI